MTKPGVNPEKLHTDVGEAVDQEITLESRIPAVVMPTDSMWPMRLHDEAVHAAATEALPQLVAGLSEPIQPVTQDQIRGIFAGNPRQRRKPWHVSASDDGSYTYSAEAYLGPKDAKGSQRIYYGLNYTFDQKGRLMQFELIEGDW